MASPKRKPVPKDLPKELLSSCHKGAKAIGESHQSACDRE